RRGALARSGRPAGDQSALFFRGNRPPGGRRRAQDGAAPLRSTGNEEIRPGRNLARGRGRDRRPAPRLCPAIWLDRVSRQCAPQEGGGAVGGGGRPAAGGGPRGG